MRKSALDLLGLVRALLSNAPMSTFSDAAILTVASETLNYLAAIRRPHELSDTRSFSTVAGQSLYEVDDDIARVVDVFVDGQRISETSVSDILYQEERYGEGTPLYWTMWTPAEAPPYAQRMRLIPTPDSSYDVRLAVIKAHPQLVIDPAPTPILLGPGHFLPLCELVAEKLMLQIAPQEAQAFSVASRDQVEDAAVYQRRSRSVSSKPNRVGGAIIPRSRRRSSW